MLSYHQYSEFSIYLQKAERIWNTVYQSNINPSEYDINTFLCDFVIQLATY